jgi:hypothetical protein
VPLIDFDALQQLPDVAGATTIVTWTSKRRWLEDDSLYEGHNVPIRSSRGIPSANLRPEWIERLQATGVICPVQRSKIRGWTRIHAVPEPAKTRFRCIMNTADINGACGRDTIEHCTFPTKRTISEAVHDGEWCIALDFAAYYYQFALDPLVGRRMCFAWNRRFFRLCRLAMGQRQAVDVANASTMRLLDFPHESKRVLSIIDNVLFVGTRDAVTSDAWTFIQRCKAVRATLNEIDVTTATRADVEALARQAGPWGGVDINLVDKTVALTQKVVDKTRQSWANRGRWQWRHFAAHIGLLFWAWGIVELPMASFFPVLRFNSEVGKMAMQALADERRARGLPDDAMPANPFWRQPAHVWDSVAPVLQRWTEMVLANAPRVVRPLLDPEVLLECDASKWGWSCYGLHLATDEPFAYSEPWSEEMRRRFGEKLGESTLSEPFGVVFSLVVMRERFPTATRFGVTSDNTVAVISHQRGFNSRSWAINECLRMRDERFPQDRYSIVTRHVPGVDNIADGGSRGYAVREMTGGEKQKLRCRWGDTERAVESISSIE